MAQLMPTKVILTLLLSCLVFVAHKHAIVQVHSWVRGHGDKAPRLPQQEAASEVNACPCHHALIAVCMSRFWVENPAWKHRENMSFFFSAIDFLAQVHKV